jgi:hypothetical protein
MEGWVLAFVLLASLPDGQGVIIHGRDDRSFASREACLDALAAFHVAGLPLPSGVRVSRFVASCAPDTPPNPDPAPAPSWRDGGA